jgi:ADP-ribose pyrophosphatase YjhB (NUDIX family)
MECTVHKLVADVAVFAEARVLLVKYKDTSRYDHQEGWFLPDDYLDHEEHPEDAAKRILAEQAGLAVPSVGLDAIESFGNGSWHLIFHYRADIDRALPVGPTGNVAAAEWFALGGLPAPSEVAHHGWALDVLSKMIAP